MKQTLGGDNNDEEEACHEHHHEDQFLSDPVFEDISTILTDRVRRKKFREICSLSFTRTVELGHFAERLGLESDSRITHFDDWKICVSMMLQMGFLDLSKSNEEICQKLTTHSRWSYSVDGDGRIVVLRFSQGMNRAYWNRVLPPGISNLTHLKRLCIWGQDYFRSLPLQELSKLESLYLDGCSDLLSENLRGQLLVELPNMKELSLMDIRAFPLLQRCVRLENLELSPRKPSDIESILGVLRASGSSFARTLRTLRFTTSNTGVCQIDGNQLATLLLEVVPGFPGLETLEFRAGIVDILKFEVVADRIRGETQFCSGSKTLNRSLRYLRFYASYTPKDLKQINHDKCLRVAMLEFLKVHVAIEHIELPRGIKLQPDWEYAMIMNISGRRIFEGTHNDSKVEGDSKSSSSSINFPLSAWPIVMERLQRKIDERSLLDCTNAATRKASGIYYILRERPALIGQRVSVSSTCDYSPLRKRKLRE